MTAQRASSETRAPVFTEFGRRNNINANAESIAGLSFQPPRQRHRLSRLKGRQTNAPTVEPSFRIPITAVRQPTAAHFHTTRRRQPAHAGAPNEPVRLPSAVRAEIEKMLPAPWMKQRQNSPFVGCCCCFSADCLDGSLFFSPRVARHAEGSNLESRGDRRGPNSLSVSRPL